MAQILVVTEDDRGARRVRASCACTARRRFVTVHEDCGLFRRGEGETRRRGERICVVERLPVSPSALLPVRFQFLNSADVDDCVVAPAVEAHAARVGREEDGAWAFDLCVLRGRGGENLFAAEVEYVEVAVVRE